MAEVMALFDVVIESSKVGVRKPDPRFYEMACELLDVEARRGACSSTTSASTSSRRGDGHDDDQGRSTRRRPSPSSRRSSASRWPDARSTSPANASSSEVVQLLARGWRPSRWPGCPTRRGTPGASCSPRSRSRELRSFTKCHGPMFSGSSCSQTTSRRSGSGASDVGELLVRATGRAARRARSRPARRRSSRAAMAS